MVGIGDETLGMSGMDESLVIVPVVCLDLLLILRLSLKYNHQSKKQQVIINFIILFSCGLR